MKTSVGIHIGISSVQHFLVDGLCICCMYLLADMYCNSIGAYGNRLSMGGILLYNVLAFMSQPLTGLMADRLPHRPAAVGFIIEEE